jgi:hypothetical protein
MLFQLQRLCSVEWDYHEIWVGKDLEGDGRRIFTSISTLAWSDWVKPWRNFRILVTRTRMLLGVISEYNFYSVILLYKPALSWRMSSVQVTYVSRTFYRIERITFHLNMWKVFGLKYRLVIMLPVRCRNKWLVSEYGPMLIRLLLEVHMFSVRTF